VWKFHTSGYMFAVTSTSEAHMTAVGITDDRKASDGNIFVYSSIYKFMQTCLMEEMLFR
jgi:hypothetical protein